MVHNNERTPGVCKCKDYTQSQLDKAVEAVKNGTSMRKTAEEIGISKSTINREINKKHTDKVGRPFVLEEEDQQKLTQHLYMAGDWGFPLTVYDIRLIIKAFPDR